MIFNDIAKAELHCHLELTLREPTIKELAPLVGIKIKDQSDFTNQFLIKEPMQNLGAVLNKFLDTQKLLFKPEIIERITYEYCKEVAAQGVKILELRYAPTFLNAGHDFSFQEGHDAVVRGTQRAEADFNMAVGLICIIQRIFSADEAQKVVDFAIKNKDTFVALDLADNEEGFDSKPFAPLFHAAKEAGLHITVHSGEAPLPKAPRYIMDAIEYLGAERIGHGIQCIKDETVMQYLIDHKIPLEVCPTSNWLTQAVPTLDEHPIKKLYEKGVLITINTDDPGIFDVDINSEYKLLQEKFQFSLKDFESINDCAAAFSFIPLEKKQKVWPRPIKSIGQL